MRRGARRCNRRLGRSGREGGDIEFFTESVFVGRPLGHQVARRHQRLSAEIDDLDALITPLVTRINPALYALLGVGPDIAGQLLVTAGGNPHRLRSEAAFAMLCGAAPLPASSGRTQRHRLNRGGDRQANCALYQIVLCRLR